MVIHLRINNIGDFPIFQGLQQLPLDQTQGILWRIVLLVKLGKCLLA